MGDYSADAYAAQAEALDPQLLDAVTRDLHVSGEQYLADSAAAADASYVVQDLTDDGYDLLGSRIDGTRLTVYVDSDPAARAAESAGADVVFGAPDAPTPDTSNAVSLSDLYGGQGYAYLDVPVVTSGVPVQHIFECSVGFNGHDTNDGSDQFVSAGHCFPPGQSLQGSFRALTLAHAGDSAQSGLAGTLGLPDVDSFHFGDDLDSGLVDVTQAGWNLKPQVLNWGGGAGGPLQSAPVNVTDARPAVIGASLCKSGARTGWTCGRILDVDADVVVNGNVHVNSIIADTCADHGDSGGSALTGTVAIGITSAGSSLACGAKGYFSSYFPMVSAWGSISSQHQDWEPSVVVPPVTVTSPANGGIIFQGSPMTGTMLGANPTDQVNVTIAGDPASPRTATAGSDGKWSLSLSGLALGTHSYSIHGSWNTQSVSPSLSGSLTIVTRPSVSQLSGNDRYSTAVAIANAAYPDHADVVYVATGENYPDALSAAPAAVQEHGPLMLVPPSGLPDFVGNKIAQLHPDHIIVVGGPTTVPDAIVTQLTAIAPTTRIAGVDRFATSRLITAHAFQGTVKNAYIATGFNYPDALSASAVAAGNGSPVILVPGTYPALDTTTTTFIQNKGITNITIAGDPNAVSTPIMNQLKALPGITTVQRLSGIDRYATSGAINRASFTTATNAYYATGSKFPDALAGAALAGAKHAPLYVVPTDCVPAYDLQDIPTLGITNITLLGDTNSLTTNVKNLKPC